jgi:hypothetical protein
LVRWSSAGTLLGFPELVAWSGDFVSPILEATAAHKQFTGQWKKGNNLLEKRRKFNTAKKKPVKFEGLPALNQANFGTVCYYAKHQGFLHQHWRKHSEGPAIRFKNV